MPQVAARINEEQERWLKDYFRTKSAGAEFILPWAVDTFFRGISNVKSIFTPAELKTIVESYLDDVVYPIYSGLADKADDLYNKIAALKKKLKDGTKASQSLRLLGFAQLHRGHARRLHQAVLAAPAQRKTPLLPRGVLSGWGRSRDSP